LAWSAHTWASSLNWWVWVWVNRSAADLIVCVSVNACLLGRIGLLMIVCVCKFVYACLLCLLGLL
jgi:hypothetical protein